MSISAGLLLAAAAQGSPWDDPAPTGRWSGSTAKLASELLPPEMAAAAVSHEVHRGIFEGGPPYMVSFAGKTRTSSGGFCERYRYNVYISTIGEVKEGSPHRRPELRLGDCRDTEKAVFTNINADDEAGTKLALHWIEWARAQARSSRTLPFKLSCRSETEEKRCGDGGRKALADLPIEKIFGARRTTGAPAHHWEIWVTETEPGQKLWDVAVDATPGRSSIDLVWKIPAPF